MDKKKLETTNTQYRCVSCDHFYSRKYDYEQHLKTGKHKKKTAMYEQLHEISFGKKEKKIQTIYFCNYCDFSTTKKKDAITHLTTKQHIQNESKEEEILEIVQQYICTNCDTSYNKYKSCWEHSKRCQGKKENIIVELLEILLEESRT